MSARRIAAVTFTNKAAREMKERVGQMLKGREAHAEGLDLPHPGLNIIRGELKALATSRGSRCSTPRTPRPCCAI